MPNGIEIDETDFEKLDHALQMRAIFKAIVVINNNISKQPKICEEQFKIKALHNRKWKDKGIAGVAGLIGGFLAGLSKRLI